MKRIILLLIVITSINTSIAQIQTEIDGFPVTLQQATKGELNLYWCVHQRRYYFFVQTSTEDLVPLKATSKGAYFYKAELSKLTGGYGNTNDLVYELKPIQSYINAYNATLDPNYQSFEVPARLQWHATLFGGITNNPFVRNSANVMNPQAGVEFEFSSNVPLPMHTGFAQLRHAFKSTNFNYQTTEINLGYRFRFLRQERFQLFAQVKLMTINFNEAVVQDPETEALVRLSNTSFDAPFIFGVGGDLKVGKRSYISLMYSELFAVFLDHQGNFPVDIVLGYKMRL